MVAELKTPTDDPFVGLERVRLMVSEGSTKLSSTMRMDIVLLISPLAKLTIMGVLIKSSGAIAVPLNRLSSTLTSPSLPFERVRVIVVAGTLLSLKD